MRVPQRAALVAAAWSVPALLASFETLAFWRLSGRGDAAWRAVAAQAPGWLVYALLTPAILALGRRFPVRLPRRAPLGTPALAARLGLHLAAALVAGLAYAGAAAAASALVVSRPATMSAARLFAGWYLSGLPVMVLAYAGVLGAGHATEALAEARRRETEAARLAAQLAEARLGALRAQLHPHFLFNSLNAATVLARDAAAPGGGGSGATHALPELLEGLSGLLREVLHPDAGHEAPLADEVAFARRYLDVERARFPDRLRVRVDVEAGLGDVLVPRLVLQPLVENALRHGIGRRLGAGRLEIGARRAGAGAVELWVADDGAGLPSDWDDDDGFGVGLANTAARLAELYGPAAALSVHPAPGGGAVARVRLPLGRAPHAPGARSAAADT